MAPEKRDKSQVHKVALKGSAKTVAEFFEYSIHTILFQRGVYPAEDFTAVKKYGLNMLVSSDDQVKAYIKKIMKQLNTWMQGGKISKLVVVITSKETGEHVERWQFNVEIFNKASKGKSSRKTTDKENVVPDDGAAAQPSPEKTEEQIQEEIQAIFRQITASVTFLPVLDGNCTFNVLVYADADSDVPIEWGDSDAKEIKNGEKVQLRSFSTSNHRVDTLVAIAVPPPGKPVVVDDAPKVIKALQFGVFSDQDIVNRSQVQLADRRLFDLNKGRAYAEFGPLDPRLGISGKHDICKTCGERLQQCNGHFGHVALVLPVFHVGYFKKVIQILQSICKECSAILLPESERRRFLSALRRAEGDGLRMAGIIHKVAALCKKAKTCFECGAVNGVVRKAGSAALKISHDKFKTFNSSTSAKKVPPVEKILFDESFVNARQHNSELDKHLKKAQDDLNALRVLKLFRRVKDADRELLGLRKADPSSFLWRYVPAPPVCIRPSVGQEGSSTEDDITAKLGDIINANNLLREALAKGAPVQSLVEHWDYLGLQLAMYINSDVPGLAKAESGRSIRGFVQRLKGKQGRFRGNLSGKRVDFSGRTVISPDPNLAINEVAVPILVAKNMTYPEVVTTHNLKKLRQRVQNGASQWPGANFVLKKGSEYLRIMLKFANRDNVAKDLKYGDIVERHLEDGDVVLFNRQPSLHKLSILSHYVRVRPHRTFRLNECVCNPYNADFDGDEMNLHVPQTEEARTEAVQLMGVKHNLVTPKNGEPIIAAIQDFITASYLLSSLDVFYDRKTFATICAGMFETHETFELPPPSILKPQCLWTGKQVFNVLMRPNKQSNIMVNLEASCRDHKDYHPGLHRDLQDDSYLRVYNSEVMCGRMDKATVGAGKKNSLFYVLYRDFGPDAATRCMNRISKLCARWLGNQGFSVGISDVTPPDMLKKTKSDMIGDVFNQCAQFVVDSKAGKLKRRPGLDDAGTLEAEQVRVLSTVRTNIASILTSQLSKNNSPMVMATSGSKGSAVNVTQMAALLGQQDIEGKRVQDGFQDRTLPHFPKHERSPPSKGFVSNSFFSGLLPYEFLFHAIGGRVGLVDTAVKTAETGYMSRRLMKSLEDLSAQYDRTVRNSESHIVQFRFGDDELDPVDMEASAKPVDFDRTFAHVEATTYKLEDEGLRRAEIESILESKLSVKRKELTRRGLDGTELRYDADEDQDVDQHESARTFLRSINDFIMGKVALFEAAREEKQSTEPTPPSATSGTKRKKAEADDAEPEEEASGSRRAPRAAAAAAKGAKKAKLAPSDGKEVVKGLAGPSTKDRFELTCKISEKTLKAFVDLCLEKYEKARTEPGHAVGAVGAQSIGEPGTQMTLKTFHFAGVAGMSLTAGVPRIKEIINASKEISTPVITCRLERRRDLSIPEGLARVVKGRIECLYLEDVTSYIQISHSIDRPSCLYVKISTDTIDELGLDITIDTICEKIRTHKRIKGGKLRIQVRGKDQIKLSADSGFKISGRGRGSKADEGSQEMLLHLQLLRRILPGIHIAGHPLASRAVVMAEDDPMSDQIRAKRIELGLEESGKPAEVDTAPVAKQEESTRSVSPEASRKGKGQSRKGEPAIKIEDDSVNPYATTTNSVVETLRVLGIEAARSKIITEIQEVTKDLSIDPRHMYLLSDVMTYKGEVLGITRFGLAKMRDSVLQLASFEKTADHVFDAGVMGKSDGVKGVSECVIVGKAMGVGTGAVEVVRGITLKENEVGAKKCVFEDAWRSLQARADTLRAALKDYERAFAAQHEGRKPTKEDIKADGEVAAKYREYNKVRDAIAGKGKIIDGASGSSNRAWKHARTPISEGRKFMLSQFFATPSTVRYQQIIHTGETPETAKETTTLLMKTPLMNKAGNSDKQTAAAEWDEEEKGRKDDEQTPRCLKRTTSFKDRLLSASSPRNR
ncbi:hypothetical protein DV735_g4155, partial [Chaetothyriales sp. CBS 134920]